MTDRPEVDLSFAEAPALDEAAAHRAGLPGRPRRPLRRAGLVVLLLTLLAGAAAYAVFQIGWRRLEAQVAREVAYEDEQARAGQVDLVRAVLARDDEAWLSQRAAEVTLGLAAPLPAGHLVPVDTPPRLTKLASAGVDLFEATVVRTYADAAGGTYDFALVQRYRNLGPGLWERLPPDTAPLANRRTWSGQRLSAGLPAADGPWLKDALAQADAALVQTCAAWGSACPEDLVIPVTFASDSLALPPPVLPAYAEGSTTGQPLSFALAPGLPPEGGRLVLPSPHLAGLPQDDAAQAAFTRATVAQVLLYLGRRVAGPAQNETAYYRDALLARAEFRLGLTPALDPALALERFQSPAATLDDSQSVSSGRLQALAFFDHVLAGQPNEVDGQLLASLRRSTDLQAWLEGALGPTAEAALASWTELVNTHAGAGAALPLAQLDGLASLCQGAVLMIRGEQPQHFPLPVPALGLEPTARSRAGRYLAYLTRPPSVEHVQLNLLDLDTGRAQPLNVGRGMVVVGWTAADELVYLKREPLEEGLGDAFYLMRYSRRGYHLQLQPQPVQRAWPSAGQWLADGTAVALTLDVPLAGASLQTAPALVSVTALDELQWLAGEGHSPVLAPDGRTAAYVVSDDFVGGTLNFGTNIELRDLASGERRRLVTSQAVTFDSGPTTLLHLEWSPDGTTLAFVATGQQYGVRLFTVPAGGGPVELMAHLGGESLVLPPAFSADGRYLSYATAHAESTALLTVVDRHTDARTTYTTTADGSAWSPTGHLLAVAGQGGVFVTDPATAATRWLTFSNCSRAAWYKE